MPSILVPSLTDKDRAHFAREADRDAAETRAAPSGAATLLKGQRVEFTLNVGPGGSCYATEVQLITDAPEKKADRSA